MRLDQLGEPVIDLLPDLARHHRFERRGRHFEGEVARPAVAGVDDRAIGAGRRRPAPTRNRATASIGFWVADRPMRCRLSPHSASSRSSDSARCDAALVRRHRVDLVDDDACASSPASAGRIPSRAGCRATPAWSRRYAAAGGASGRARRPACRRCAPRCGSRRRAALRARSASRDAGERRFEIALDVVRQRLERRDVDDLRLVVELRPRAPAAPARRSPRGRRPASCPIRSAPRSARAGPPGSPARPAPAPRSAPRKLRSNQSATAGWNRE